MLYLFIFGGNLFTDVAFGVLENGNKHSLKIQPKREVGFGQNILGKAESPFVERFTVIDVDGIGSQV